QLLAAASIVGRSFDLETARAVSGRSDDEAVEAVEELVRLRLVQEVERPQAGAEPLYDFSHAKLREVVYDGCGLARRRLLHLRAAEAIVSRPGRRREPEQAAVVAGHYRSAGREAEAAEWYARAGAHAASVHAHSDALGHLSSALALGHPDPASLHERIGDLQTLMGDYASALSSYEAAAAFCPPDRVVVIEHRLGAVQERRGRPDLADGHFRAALEAVGGDDTTRARLLAERSLAAHRMQRPDDAADLARQAADVAASAGDRLALSQAHNILGILESRRGHFPQAREHLARSLDFAGDLDDPSPRIAALNNLALTERAQGNLEESAKLIRRALDESARQQDLHRKAALHGNLADVLHEMGRTDESKQQQLEAVTLFFQIGERDESAQPGIWKLVEW
ncbi:MAG TPA: tetratricopeptide repeat protein, partial [Actinomycetota bacterium]|nr:tetratricopeptide repeat protein [Actinomycetota bacterium]